MIDFIKKKKKKKKSMIDGLQPEQYNILES